jgi:hypothetical protein
MLSWLRSFKLNEYVSSNKTKQDKDHGVGSEVNPESWTQLKGSNEKGI